jgi:hypothetical protein
MNTALAILFYAGGFAVVASYDSLSATGDRAWVGIKGRLQCFWAASGVTTAVLFVLASVHLYRHADADTAQRLLPVYALFYAGAASWAPLTVRALRRGHGGDDTGVLVSLTATSAASVLFLAEVLRADEHGVAVAAGVVMVFQHVVLDSVVWYSYFRAWNYEAVPASKPDKQPDKQLVAASWNLSAALFHFAFAVVIVALAETKGAPFVVKMERMWREPRFDAPIRGTNTTIGELVFDNPWCGDKDYVACKRRDECSIFDWFDCLKSEAAGATTGRTGSWIVDSNDIEGRFYDLAPQTVARPPVWAFLFAFELITAFFHYGAARLWAVTYQKMLKQNMQPFRWLEYSITSSIMLLCLYALSRITDVYLLWANVGLSVFLELCGGLCFEFFGFLLETNKGPKEPFMAPEVADMVFYARWGFYALSVAVFAFNIFLVWDAFVTILDPYSRLTTAPLWDELFSWIRVLNAALLGLYSVFPVIHLFEFVSREEFEVKENFLLCEKLYIVASFVAKGTLVWSVFYGAMSRQDSDA